MNIAESNNLNTFLRWLLGGDGNEGRHWRPITEGAARSAYGAGNVARTGTGMYAAGAGGVPKTRGRKGRRGGG
jgi:hypothetical protein